MALPSNDEALAAREPEPEGFRPARTMRGGRHLILEGFPGLDRLAPARRLVPEARARTELFESTDVELVDQDLWMYVAPYDMPAVHRPGWRPVISPGRDCVVVGRGHLGSSPSLVLYLDIYHELCHILQRRGGADLWPPGKSYVQRWTEVEAYRFVIDEARRLGVSDEFLREYLRVEWISADEHRTLLAAVGVAAQNP